MKAKLTIEPGCEAGSLYCKGCDYFEEWGIIGYCVFFPDKNNFNNKLIRGADGSHRCQPCLDAEQKEPNGN